MSAGGFNDDLHGHLNGSRGCRGRLDVNISSGDVVSLDLGVLYQNSSVE